MALIESLEKQGNFLFKYRGQFPTLLFLLAIPFICFTDYSCINPQLCKALLFCAVVLSVLGFIIRCYTIGTTPRGTSGRNTKEQVADVLNSTGIYSTVRHPIYLGNYLIWLGISVFTYSFYFMLVMSLLFWIYYERIMYAEERFLERKFGIDYLNWSNKFPAFIPSFKGFVSSDTPFSIISVLRREYAGVLATVIGFAFIELSRNYFISNKLKLDECMILVLGVTIVVVFILRNLKHYTQLLNEANRS